MSQEKKIWSPCPYSVYPKVLCIYKGLQVLGKYLGIPFYKPLGLKDLRSKLNPVSLRRGVGMERNEANKSEVEKVILMPRKDSLRPHCFVN